MIEVIDHLSPFSFLNRQERLDFLALSEVNSYQPGDVICEVTQADYDWLYILLIGKASVNINNRIKGYIDAPAYFGELSVFFDQPRSARIIAVTDVNCLRIAGKHIREWVHKNSSFRYQFASFLKDKQKLFLDYNTFIANLIANHNKHAFSMNEIVPFYKKLRPVLHRGCDVDDIDFQALSYVIRKLNFNVTAAQSIFLSEDFPTIFREVHKIFPKNLFSRVKKYAYEILPGKILFILRDDISDFIDIMTKLSLYLIEAEKIYDRIVRSKETVRALCEYYFNRNKSEKAIRKILPFNDLEVKSLYSIFGERIYIHLYELVAQQCDIAVQVKSSGVRYYAIASELWINEIRNLLVENYGELFFDEDIKVHIISSNTHSVKNCLSAWSQDQKNLIMEWHRECHSDMSLSLNKEDELYFAINQFLKTYPEKNEERDSFDRKYGLIHFEDTCLTGIDVTVIDVKKLAKQIDPFIKLPNTKTKEFIINIDYAYGRQAKIMLQGLILLFNKQIASISIFGKAGGMIGKRGDILLPESVLLQENDILYSTFQTDISANDFRALNWQRNIINGTILTVQGTLMQSRNLLQYYQLFWNTIGIEMEGGYYLKEIDSAMNYGLIDSNIPIRVVYYVSDRPLTHQENLTIPLHSEEGVPAVYTITRCMLNKIFNT